jgi:dienelactone hydrolase
MSKRQQNDRGLPVTPGEVPNYRAIVRATDAYCWEFRREVARRRRERERRLASIAAAPDAQDAFASFAAGVRRGLLKALGRFEPRAGRIPPVLRRTSPVTAGGRGLVVRRYGMPGAARRGGDLGLLEVRPRAGEPQPLLLLLGDVCAHVQGGESAETVASRWGYRFAEAGYAVVIPELLSLRDLSATRNKALLLEGTCTLGELVDDAERVLDAALRLPGLDGRRAWAGGSGLGGLTVLALAALDRRVCGVLSADAPRDGDLDSSEAFTIPNACRLVDMAQVVAATAPAPVALLEAGAAAWGNVPASLAWVDASAKGSRRACGAAASYLRLSARGYSGRALQKLIDWMDAQERPTAEDHRPARLPRRRRGGKKLTIASSATLRAWQQTRRPLRRAFFRALGQPERHKPVNVCHIARDELEDCVREELDVWSSEHTAAKVVFLRPREAEGPTPTVLCLPGSSSHAGRVEARYAHEVVARGWNAVVVDCRARIYRHYPGIREGRVLIGLSVYDQLCVVDYLVTRHDVDAKRIGVMGLSQGGIHSWMLAALDERIAAAAPVCGIASYRSLIEDVRDEGYDRSFLSFLDSHSYYYYLPGILRVAEQADLIGLLAPRPLTILGATHDHVFPERGIREVYDKLKRLYELYDARENLSIYLYNGPHSMPPRLRCKAYRFFEKHL